MYREDIFLAFLGLLACSFIALLVYIDRAYPEADNTTVIYKSDRLACDGRG